LDGIYIYCINLNPDADEYVQDILGNQYTVIDHIESLPEKVPQLSMALTKKMSGVDSGFPANRIAGNQHH
jgi:hypothetical protein